MLLMFCIFGERQSVLQAKYFTYHVQIYFNGRITIRLTEDKKKMSGQVVRNTILSLENEHKTSISWANNLWPKKTYLR